MRECVWKLVIRHDQQHDQQHYATDPAGRRELRKELSAHPQEPECERGEADNEDQNSDKDFHAFVFCTLIADTENKHSHSRYDVCVMQKVRRATLKRCVWKGPLPGCQIIARHRVRGCAGCHAAYMRSERAAGKYGYKYTEKTKARAILGVYLRRGKMKRLPCRICGNTDVQAHHPDYSKPLEVDWLCRKHLRETIRSEQ